MSGAHQDAEAQQNETSWRSFVWVLVGSAFGLTALVYFLVLIIDPYDSVPFSPSWERYPVTSHSRPYNASLARSGRFDSAVIGNSTSMLLHPTELNAQFGGRFVNLAMPAASPYEQLRVLDLLYSTRTYTGTLIVGLDPFWCAPDGSPRLLQPMMGQRFPEELYDDIRWNDFPPLNQTTLQHARSQLLALLGVRVRHPKRPDGYRDFTRTYRADKGLEAVRQRIYGEAPWALQRTHDDRPPSFPDIDALAAALSRFPARTLKVVYVVPFHAHHQPEAGSAQYGLWMACKSKAAALPLKVPNAAVIDFMIESPITTNDENYVDAQHYTTAVASRLAILLHEATVKRSRGDVSDFHLLSRSGDEN